ncbi:MAG: alpha/beta hydrolase [Candidatus Promineifilaceae bacterium]
MTASTYPSAIAGPERRYRLYRPPCFGQDGRAYPVLYLFHGSVQDENHWDRLGIGETAERLIAAGEIPPLLIVMPDGGWIAQGTSGGPGSFEAVVTQELLPHIEGLGCVWAEPAGRAIGGLSRGGYWALEIAFRHPDDFASVGGHSAALLDTHADSDVNPQFTGLSGALGDLRIYLDIGANDYVIANVIRLHQDLEAAGVAHAWHLNQGGHEDAYWSAQTEAYLRWYAAPWPAVRESYPTCALNPAATPPGES